MSARGAGATSRGAEKRAGEQHVITLAPVHRPLGRVHALALLVLLGLTCAASEQRRERSPSARLFYSLAASGDTGAMSNQLADSGSLASRQVGPGVWRLHERLMELRASLEQELSSASRRELAVLGSPCTRSEQCRKSVANSHCRQENSSCACLPNHVELDASTCLPTTLLGYNCQIDAQCQHRVANSFCDTSTHTCACQPNTVPYRKDKCLAPSKLNDFCLAETQCQLADKHSQCKWKIPNVYGTCKCPPNYKLLASTDNSSTPVCTPRLGDACLSDHECARATPNSKCRLSSPLVPRGRWPTSGASELRCHCSHGFAPAQNRLDCVKLWPEAGAVELSAKEQYELVGAELAPSPTSAPSTTTTSTTPTPTTTTREPSSSGGLEPSKLTTRSNAVSQQQKYSNTTLASAGSRRPPTEPRPSSLGKSCSTRLECQARDRNSDCIGGICECLRPTGGCSARSTGCPRDTFQCRSGQCISWYFVCDQFRNCDDGSDELECTRNACPPEAFQCRSDGRCVARAKLCNGKRDCSDASDELHCDSLASPTLAQGPPAGAEPAEAPSNATGRCPAHTFACRDGTCLPGYVFCNAVDDCADGSDEDVLLCERRAAKSPSGGVRLAPAAAAQPPVASAASGQSSERPQRGGPTTSGQQLASGLDESPLVKTDRASIERLRASLAALSPARTPEQRGRQASKQALGSRRRAKSMPPHRQVAAAQPLECPRWAFECDNGKCRSSAILCSGVDGCGDNSDERQCEVCQCAPAVR